jgi:hypothetical protein
MSGSVNTAKADQSRTLTLIGSIPVFEDAVQLYERMALNLALGAGQTLDI